VDNFKKISFFEANFYFANSLLVSSLGC